MQMDKLCMQWQRMGEVNIKLKYYCPTSFYLTLDYLACAGFSRGITPAFSSPTAKAVVYFTTWN